MTKTVYNVEIHQECKDCHGDLLACDKERYSRASIPVSPWSKFPLNSRWGAAASMGWKKWEYISLSSCLGGLGECCELPQQVSGWSPSEKKRVHSKRHRTLLLARYRKYSKCRTIIIFNLPSNFPKKIPLFFLAAFAPRFIWCRRPWRYCLLLLALT